MGAIKANAAAFGFRFPILHDKDTVVASPFDARTAPEVFFFNGENILLYRGAIDNDSSGSTVTENYLTVAFEASLAGKPIFKKSVMPRGCAIKRAKCDFFPSCRSFLFRWDLLIGPAYSL